MAEIAIFDDEAFTVTALTAALNDQPYLPGRISALGLFREEGITTLTVQIEKDGDTLALVPAGERGGSGLVVAAKGVVEVSASDEQAVSYLKANAEFEPAKE